MRADGRHTECRVTEDARLELTPPRPAAAHRHGTDDFGNGIHGRVQLAVVDGPWAVLLGYPHRHDSVLTLEKRSAQREHVAWTVTNLGEKKRVDVGVQRSEHWPAISRGGATEQGAL